MLNPQVERLNNLQLQELKFQILNKNLPTQIENRNAGPSLISESNPYTGGIIRGLSYPLQINGGGLKISSNSDRIYEQILEVLETRVGERIMRQFFGIPDLIFESFSEDLLRNTIIKQIRESLPIEIETDMDLSISEEGYVIIYLKYKLNGDSSFRTIRYEVR